jgi:hypothetical protein
MGWYNLKFTFRRTIDHQALFARWLDFFVWGRWLELIDLIQTFQFSKRKINQCGCFTLLLNTRLNLLCWFFWSAVLFP